MPVLKKVEFSLQESKKRAPVLMNGVVSVEEENEVGLLSLPTESLRLERYTKIV